jgi:hypothetical protein
MAQTLIFSTLSGKVGYSDSADWTLWLKVKVPVCSDKKV